MYSKNTKKRKTFRQELTHVMLGSLLIMAVVIIAMMFGTNYYFSFQSASTNAQARMLMEKDIVDRQMYTILQAGKLAADNAVLKKDIEGREYVNGAFVNEVSIELLHILKLDDLIQFVAVTRERDTSMKYVGEKWVPDKLPVYEQLYRDFDAADPVAENIRVTQAEDVFGSGHYSILFFFEVYGTDPVLKRLGMVCIAVDERALSALMETAGAAAYVAPVLTDSRGRILSCTDEQQIGMISTVFDQSQSEKYSLFSKTLILSSDLDSFGWKIVSTVSTSHLMEGYIPALIFIVILAIAITIIAAALTLRYVNHLNRTLQTLQAQMAVVAEGDMTTRMEEDYPEQEFYQISNSFNRMVDAVGELMIRISEEQNQMKQIEMNALQSQIKPHFLYNTLDIIHWQAVIDGNTTISSLVKALAQYYRLSLSRGKDIVDLKAELEHIRNYLIIQNTRFENRLLLEIEMPEDLLSTPVPKMTLQPLVENAIEHGLKRIKEGKGTILIKAAKSDDGILISVSDDGVGMPEEKVKELNSSIQSFDANTGYGLQNVNRRLQLYFGEAFGLQCESAEGSGTTVYVRVPEDKVALQPWNAPKEYRPVQSVTNEESYEYI